MAAIDPQPEQLRSAIESAPAVKFTGSSRADRGVDHKIQRRRGRGEEELVVPVVANWDPLLFLGFDLMMKILGYLDARSVALSLLVSRGWHDIASSDCLWAPMCEELWVGKAHIPRWSKVPGLPKLVSYSRAVIDSKRGRIMREDLCDHVWEFHFTKGAPDYWRNLDPYWKGTNPLMRRYFHPDGSHTADPDDKVWGGHECCYSVVTSIRSDGNMREHYVRVNRWPHLCISRRHDWGWEMSNFICAYSSIPDAYKEGGTGPV